MPTVNIDISKLFENMLKNANDRARFFGNLNSGQLSKLNSIKQYITGNAEVYIAGRDVDVSVEYDYKPSEIPEYLSETFEQFEQVLELYANKLESGRGFDSSSIIKQAFASL